MPTIKLSKRAVDKLPARSRVYIAYDDSVPGFGVRVTPTGAKSWVVEYRPNGGGRRVAKRRITLGAISTLPPEVARRAAKDVLARVRLGEDVAGEKAARRVAPSVGELVAEYMKQEITALRKPGTVALYAMYFRRHILPELGTKKARDVTRADVAKLHRRIGESAPVTANRVITLLSGLFSWAAKSGVVPEGTKPASGIGKYRENGRERYLTTLELGRLGDALREAETIGLLWEVDETKPTAKHARKPENRREKMSPFATAAIRLLLFTGCRLREILHLRWQDVDFERGMLFLPDSKTGRKPVILPGPALALLSDLPRLGPYVIPGIPPDRPRRDLKRPWEVVARRAGIIGVRLHDLRHSFAATGASSGLGLLVIGKLLGHRNSETTARYAHVGADPLKIAANRIAGVLAAALGEARDQVVEAVI